MRIINFSAGPAMLPESILLKAQSELLDWDGCGVSVMEMGHRQPKFQSLMEKSEENLRSLLNIPDNYHVLFLGGAARTQFAMIPMNFLSKKNQAGYIVSGLWSSLAYKEACKLKNAYFIGNSEQDGFKSVPVHSAESIKSNTQYLYYTPNETVNGIRISKVPDSQGLPLIADMTSCLLSEPININDYGMIFAGAQKNIAPAGLTLVIVRNDLLNIIPSEPIPTMLDYKTFAETNSKYATPPTFNIYMANKMFEWLYEQGGVAEIYLVNCEKAKLLYQYIDESNFYNCNIEVSARSIMNVCFHINKTYLEDEFVEQAEKQGLFGLKGHRLAGGLRASLYNSMPVSGVKALVNFMQSFAKDHQ